MFLTLDFAVGNVSSILFKLFCKVTKKCSQKRKSSWTGTSSFVLELKFHCVTCVPCDRIVRRAYSPISGKSLRDVVAYESLKRIGSKF